jgi:hypothetical protein
MRVEIQRISGHRFWAKMRQANEVIDLQGLSDDYWSSKKYTFIIPGQSWMTDWFADV